MRSVLDDNDFNKRGQTSRLVAWPPIQTSCNIEKNIHSYNNPLGWFYRRWDNILCEAPCNFLARQYRYTTLHSHLNRFLFENFPYPSPRPHSATATHLASTVKPSNSTEHGSIQKGSIKYTVDTSNISCLLSAFFFRFNYNTSRRPFTILSCYTIWAGISLPKLFIKPVVVLLENQRS